MILFGMPMMRPHKGSAENNMPDMDAVDKPDRKPYYTLSKLNNLYTHDE